MLVWGKEIDIVDVAPALLLDKMPETQLRKKRGLRFGS